MRLIRLLWPSIIVLLLQLFILFVIVPTWKTFVGFAAVDLFIFISCWSNRHLIMGGRR